MTKVLTEADLAGLPRPVSSEDALSLADEMDTMSDRITRYSNSGGDGMLAIGAETIRTVVSERDALAVRVSELEGALNVYVTAIATAGGGDKQLFMAAIRQADDKARAALSTTPESKP